MTQKKSETAAREEKILEFWREHKTFERSLEKQAPQGEFVFYDGPPFATGLPHHGSLLSSIIKDVIPRYKTMRGYRVRRRWGWDTHGLPIESLVEKELGLKTKKDILDIGIATFNEKARSMVLRFVDEWEKYIERIGRWVDFKNSYKTMDNTFIESVWWALKQLWDKELLYEGRKVLMYCPHCETPLAKAEIAMDNTYKNITEEAVTVKFKLKSGQKIRGTEVGDNTFILAWTTTPWTLPGNVALAVGEEIEYEVGAQKGERLIYATKLKSKLGIDGDPEQGGLLLGKYLVGIEYEPLYDIKPMQSEKSHRVYAADFVSTDEGTGIVHTAVMYGEDDFVLGQKEGLPMVQMLAPNGTYLDIAPEFLRGTYIKDAERDIKKDLEARGLLFKRENNTHSYPHCYRCGTPLIYNAVASWFINIQKVKGTMMSENKKIQWVPEHLRDGRFGNIVESAPDWTISRNRFWASPLPIWKSKSGKVLVIGSLDELKKRVKKSGNTYFVMRHGESDTNVRGVVSGNTDAPFHLTVQGRAQVLAAAAGFAETTIDRIYVSPLMRTRETADILATALGIPDRVHVDERLRELDFGEWEGKDHAEWLAAFPDAADRFETKPRGGETFLDVQRRVGSFLREIELRHTNERIVIVSHATPIRMMHAVCEGRTREQTIELFAPEFPPVASVAQISFGLLPWNDAYELDLHRPYTDNLVLIGDDGEEYTRIPEVVDCWVESGSMPFAEYHYPFENTAEFEQRAPGDFIAEYIAQTRTWFYYMHAMGVLLFNRLAFRTVVSTGTILAADGEKISKSKRNYTDPLALIDQYGADAMRLFLMSSPVMQAEDLRFRDEDVRDAHNRTIQILWNTFKFFDLYQKDFDGTTDAYASAHVLDRWILALLERLVVEMTAAMDAYDTPRACRALRAFVEDYSTWYVRRSRERVKSEWHDKHYSLATQREVLRTLAKLIAPLTPFIAEALWRGIEGGGSVHLEAWPESRSHWWEQFMHAHEAVLADMATTRATVSRALEARDKAGIKVRQPLRLLRIQANLKDENLDVIREEVNVKAVEIADIEGDVELDTELTPELKEEGFVRDLIRAIQGARKEAGLQPGESATVTLQASDDVQNRIQKHLKELADATHVTLSFGNAGSPQKVGDDEVAFAIVK